MRTILAMLIGTLTMSVPASAKTQHARDPYRGWHERQHEARVQTYEDIRAQSADPAGNYRGYPSWARAALGPDGRKRAPLAFQCMLMPRREAR